MEPTYAITYDIVTPESAEEGEASERGYYLAGGYYHAIPYGLIGEAFTAYVEKMGYRQPLRDSRDIAEGVTVVDAAFAILDEYGCFERASHYCPGISWYQVDPDMDYRTGEDTRKAVHFDGLTEEEDRALFDRVKARTAR